MPKYFHPAVCFSVSGVKADLSYPPCIEIFGPRPLTSKLGGTFKAYIRIVYLASGFLVGTKLSFVRHVMCSAEGFESLLWTQFPNVEPKTQSLETILERDLEKDSK